MGTLTACVKKVDLSPAHKAEVFARTRRHRADGLAPSEAAKRAVRDLISEIRAGQASAARKAAADAQARAEDAERAALMAEFDVESLSGLKDEEVPLAAASLDEAAAAAYLGITPEELQREGPVSQDEPGQAGPGETPTADAGGQAQPAAAVGSETAADGAAAGLSAAQALPRAADAMPAAGDALSPDSPSEVLSRANEDGPAAGVGAEDLRRMVARVSAGWRGDGPVVEVVEVVATVQDLPAPTVDTLRSRNALGNTRGLRMPDGQIYLVADKLDSMAEAQAVLFHEVYGHEGLRAFLGDEYVTMMALLRAANPKLRGEAEAWFRDNGQDEIAARVARGLSQKEAQAIVRALAVEEALADRAGDNGPPNAWKTLMSRLQAALRKLGLGWIADRLEAMTEAETHAVLMGARRAIDQEQAVGALPGWLQDGLARSTDPNTPADTVREFHDTERAYGGRAAHAQALAAGRTRLPYSQWVQVRTPAFRAWFGDWEAASHRRFLDGAPIATLAGNEFAPDGVPLTEKVPKWYAEHGFSEIQVPDIGMVKLDAAAVRNSMSHGIGRDKAAAFAAVPDVLRRGRILRREGMRGSADGTVYHVAAPIEIGGREFVADVLVRSDANAKRMYVHEVVLKEKLRQSTFKTGAVASEGGKLASADAGAIRSVLREVYAVNPAEISKATDPDTGEPRVMFHGAGADFDRFKGKQAEAIFLTDEPIFAQAYADTSSNWLQTRGEDGAPRIMPVYANAKNAFDFENPAHVDAVMAQFGQHQEPVQRWALASGEWNIIEHPDVQRAIKAAGFDSFYVHESGFKNLAVYDQPQVKSAIGNRGSFDPEEPSILLSRKQPPAPSPTKPLASSSTIVAGPSGPVVVDGRSRHMGESSNRKFRQKLRGPIRKSRAQLQKKWPRTPRQLALGEAVSACGADLARCRRATGRGFVGFAGGVGPISRNTAG